MVDSGSCLPEDLLRKWAVTVVPHRLVMGGREFRDGVDIRPDDFYAALRTGADAPSTSGPSPADFLEAFSRIAAVGRDVLCITIAAGFSATCQSARSARDMAVEALDGARIEIIDSGTAAGGAGLLALAAARWATAGLGIDEVARRARSLAPRVSLVAFLDSLEYLHRGGRIGKMPALACGLLNIKPVVELRLGEARMVAKPRGRARATESLLNILRARAGGQPAYVNVMEAGVAGEAEELLRRVRDEFDCRLSFASRFTPVMGAHTGPGVLGIAFHTGGGLPDDPCGED